LVYFKFILGLFLSLFQVYFLAYSEFIRRHNEETLKLISQA